MKKIFTTILFLIAVLTAQSAVDPIWINHSRVDGQMQFMSNLKAWAEWMQEQGGGGGTVKAKHYAMFIIPMNDTAYPSRSGHFTQFELKGSVNNFDSKLSENQKLAFYAHSGFADDFVLNNDKIHLFVNHGGSDPRSYVKIRNTLEDLGSYAPSELIAVVDVALMNSSRPDHSWCSSENDELVWTYVRGTDIGREEEPGTDEFLWRPIAPVRWLSNLPDWCEL